MITTSGEFDEKLEELIKGEVERQLKEYFIDMLDDGDADTFIGEIMSEAYKKYTKSAMDYFLFSLIEWCIYNNKLQVTVCVSGEH